MWQASNVSWCPPDSASPQKGARSQGGEGSSALSNLVNRWYPQNLKLMIMHLLIGNQVLFEGFKSFMAAPAAGVRCNTRATKPRNPHTRPPCRFQRLQGFRSWLFECSQTQPRSELVGRVVVHTRLAGAAKLLGCTICPGKRLLRGLWVLSSPFSTATSCNVWQRVYVQPCPWLEASIDYQ